MLDAKTSGRPMIPSSVTTTSVLSDVSARAAAARAALEKAKRALLLKKEQMASLKTSKVRKGEEASWIAAHIYVPCTFFLYFFNLPQVGAVSGLGNSSSMLSLGVAAALRSFPRAAPLRFDRLGRELDEEGQVIEMKPIVHSTLKININREREEKLKQVL